MERFLENADTLEEGRVAGWVWVVARNRAYDVVREKPVTDRLEPVAPRSQSDEIAMRLVVEDLLGALPLHLADAVRANLAGQNGKEAAKSLSISEGAYRKRIYDAKAIVKELLPSDPDWLESHLTRWK